MNLLRFPFRVVQRALRSLTTIYARLVLHASGAQIGSNVVLYGAPLISRASESEIRIGHRAVLCSQSRYTALGVNHPVVIRTMRPGVVVDIGNDVGMSGSTICAMAGVSIGDETMLGANVTVVDTDFHPLAPAGRRYGHDNVIAVPVTIGRNVFIGAGSTVLKGVTIGDNSVIGAGSLVVKDIPANVIAAGNPCRVLRELPSEVPTAQ